MTTLSDLEARLASALAAEVTVHDAGEQGKRVDVPFYFPDGDGFVIYLRDAGSGQAEITDRAHTLMHVGYYTDIDKFSRGARASVFERILMRHGIQDRDGELVTRRPLDAVPEALFGFVQALMEISDMRMLDRETVRSTFSDDLRDLLVHAFGDELELAHVDRKHDNGGKFPIPYLLNHTPRPIAIFDVATDDGAAAAFAIGSQHQRWTPTIHLVAVERDQEELSRQRVAWLSDLFAKQFASLSGNEDAIVEYLRDQHALYKSLRHDTD
jgi:hypothetical protein